MLTADDVLWRLERNAYECDAIIPDGHLETVKISCESRDYILLDISIDVKQKTQRLLVRLYYSELFKRKLSQKDIKDTVSNLVCRLLEYPNSYITVSSIDTDGVVITDGNNSNIWLPSGDWQLLPPIKESEP